MSRPSGEGYPYSPLGVDEFRILRILHGEQDDHLQIRVEHHHFENSPAYDALSYCWDHSDSVSDIAIILDDEDVSYEMQLSQNLAQALRALRSTDTDGMLWADRICINQCDDLEKAQQVRLMSKIFGKAAQAIVWIGPSDEYTTPVFVLLELLCQVFVDVRDKLVACTPNLTPRVRDQLLASHELMLTTCQWAAIRTWFERPWFSRMWCFQELALTAEATIVCGDHWISWYNLWMACRALNLWDRHLSDYDSLSQRPYTNMTTLIDCYCALHYDNRLGQRMSLPYRELHLIKLIENTLQRESTLPHDKIYALLGIARDIDPASFPVKYEQQFNIAYCKATKRIIEFYGDLAILKMVSLGKEEPQILPSWVPDYRYKDEAFHSVRNVNAMPETPHHHDRMYNATGHSKVIIVPTENSYWLGLKAVLVGTITRISNPNTNYSSNSLICPSVQTGGEWSRLATTCASDEIYTPTKEPIDLAYRRLRVKDILPDEISAERRRLRVEPLYLIVEPVLHLVNNPFHNPAVFEYQNPIQLAITDCILRCTTKQRLFISNNVHMGIAHESCVVSDAVYLVPGSDMPIILRKLSTGLFRFIGEAYVHGIMDGEYLLNKFKANDESASDMTNADWLSSLGQRPLPFPTETIVMV